jgi:hypothetical protein
MIDAESPEGKEIIIKNLKGEKSQIMNQFAMYRQKVSAQLRQIQQITEKLIQETTSM